jgi:hypothetical protein
MHFLSPRAMNKPGNGHPHPEPVRQLHVFFPLHLKGLEAACNRDSKSTTTFYTKHFGLFRVVVMNDCRNPT